MNQNITCQLNDFLKGLKPEYSKYATSQAKRVMFLLDERNFIPNFVVSINTETLKSIFDVLIKNAVKFTDKGFVKVGYRLLENSVLQFFVEDTGNGFEPETLEKLTTYFDSQTGVDLEKPAENLADVNRLVKNAGGKIRIDSQLSMGTTVHFNMDYKPENVVAGADEISFDSAAAAQTKQEPASGSKTVPTCNIWEGKTILIAEDEIVNYMFLEILFEETGAILIHAVDGQLAIDAVKSNPAIELVLMDIKMPNVNGLDATRQIKAIRPQLPVIAQTAYAMQDDEYKALQAGCNDYVSKPIDANKLIALMKKYLR